MKFIVACAFAFLAIAMVASTEARADNEPACVVGTVSWYVGGPNKTLYLNCTNGTPVLAANLVVPASDTTSCPVVDIDTIKLFQQLAQTSKIFGISLRVWYVNSICGGRATRTIYAVDLNG
jgi:hypothetical protein